EAIDRDALISAAANGAVARVGRNEAWLIQQHACGRRAVARIRSSVQNVCRRIVESPIRQRLISHHRVAITGRGTNSRSEKYRRVAATPSGQEDCLDGDSRAYSKIVCSADVDIGVGGAVERE